MAWQLAHGQCDCERTALSRVGAGRDAVPSPQVPAATASSRPNSSRQHHCSSPPTPRPGPPLLYNLLFFFHWVPAVTRHESFPSQVNKLLWREWALGQGTDQNQEQQDSTAAYTPHPAVLRCGSWTSTICINLGACQKNRFSYPLRPDGPDLQGGAAPSR